MLGILQNHKQAAQPSGGLLGDGQKTPLMLMALGSALLQSGQPGGNNGFSNLIGVLQQAQAQKNAQQQAQRQAALQQHKMAFEQERFAKMQAYRQAVLGVQQGNLGVAQKRLGLDQQQFGLKQQQYQDHRAGVTDMKAHMGLLGDSQSGKPGSGLLGGKLTPQQFKALSAINFLQVGHPQGAVKMIQEAYPGAQQKLGPVDEKLLGLDADKLKRYDQHGEMASRNLAKIRQFKRALNQFETGTFAPMKLKAGQLDQGLGGLFTDANKVGSGELIRTFGTDFMLQFIERTKGAISERENKLFMQASPGLDKTPGGNLKIANAMETTNQRLLEKAKFMRRYFEVHRNLSEAESVWQRYINDNQILDQNFNINRNNISNWQGYINAPQRQAVEPQGAKNAPSDPLGILQ